MRTIAIAASVVSFLLFSGSSYGQAAARTATDTDAQIRVAVARFTEAVNRGDWEAVAAFYAEDAVLLAPNVPMARGRASIRDFFAGLQPMKPRLNISTERIVQPAADIAYEYGTYTMRLTPPGRRTVTDLGKYVTIWRRISGQWRIVADTFNTTTTTEAEPASLPQLKHLTGSSHAHTRVRRRLLYLYSMELGGFRAIQADVTRHIAQLKRLFGTRVKCGQFIERNGICMPNRQSASADALSAEFPPMTSQALVTTQADTDNLAGMLYTLDAVDSAAQATYAAGEYTPAIQNSVTEVDTSMMTASGINDCEEPYCMQDKVCDWCSYNTMQWEEF
jgi:uncharacterized protein (TIGR02246 family)